MNSEAFKGHEFIKINKFWVFDKTTYIGYKVTIKDGEISSYTEAFKVVGTEDLKDYTVVHIIDPIPIGVMRKVVNLIRKYRREAFLEH